MGRALALIVKATRLCNLRCAYCHDWRSGPDQTMPFPVLAHLAAKALQDPAYDSVEFIWHGGEPTVLPHAFYEKAVHLQARFGRPGQRVANSLQTNCTRIDAKWARFFRDFRFDVSISLDGPPGLHDAHRPYVSGRPSSADVMRGVEVLREHGVPLSALMVVDRAALALGPDPIFDFFVAQGIDHYGLLAAKPVNVPGAAPGTPAAHYVTPSEMNRFLCAYFDRWVAHGDPRIRVREFAGLLDRLDGRPSRVCTLAGSCFGRYYLVEPDGTVAHCDLFDGDPAYTLGDVLSGSFASFAAGPAMGALRSAREGELADMVACPDFAVCHGWCPHERYTASRHDPSCTPDCCGLRDLITHMRKRLNASADRPLPGPAAIAPSPEAAPVSALAPITRNEAP
jgi:uncharacterized protein